jgi:non-heme chloroperoxidase
MQSFLADDGEAIHVAISGEGRPVVLLHGWTSTHRDWNPFVSTFASNHRVFRWDARGHGGHALLTAQAPTVERMARDLENLMAHWDLHDAVVIGHSMGALTLWQYLRDFGTKRLSHVVFIDQSPRLLTDELWSNGIYGDFDAERNAAFVRDLEEDFPETVLRLVANGLNERGRRKYLENGTGMQMARERLRALDPAPLIACWKSLTAADYRQALGRIDVPALLVYGEESNFYTSKTARWVRDAIPGAQMHVYQGVDHAPHLWQAERFLHDVLGFVGAECDESCAMCA